MTSLHCTLFFALLTVYRQLDRQTDRQRHTVLNDVQRVDWTLPEASVILILRLPISDYKQQLISRAVDYKELCQRMFQLALGHVVLWLPCFVQVCVALLFTATPYTIIVAFLWLSIISSDIVFDFEVEAYKYKAVAQLIKHYLQIAEFTVLWSLGKCRNLQPLTRVSALFHRLSITFHDQKLRKHIKSDGADGRCGCTKEPSHDYFR